MNINNEIPTTSMNTVIVPLMGENWNLIQEAITSLKPHRVILCHSLSRRDLLHTNSLLLENHLTQLHKDLDIETVSLNCSEYPLALGESFAGMLRNDFNGLNNHDQTKASYNVLITQDTPLGYFFGITALSGTAINISCYLGSANADISKTQTRDFNPTASMKPSIVKFPLFQQIQSALYQFNRKRASQRIFSLVVQWYAEDKNRFNLGGTFRTSDLVHQSKILGSEELQSTISNHINKMTEWDEQIRLIEKTTSSVEYKITSLGRTVGWVMNLSEVSER